jgi:hypothetical protein
LPPLFERIAAPVSSFRLVAGHMGKRRLGKLAREIRLPALGDFAGTPLGVAGADRVRGGAEAYAG